MAAQVIDHGLCNRNRGRGVLPGDEMAIDHDIRRERWLIQGNAAQRVIAAWHMGWEPAQRASGTDWIAPLDARLLVDPYGVIRYVAARSLRSLPGYEGFEYDFLDASPKRAEQMEAATRHWMNASRTSSAKSTVLMQPDGKLDLDRLRELERTRDNRPVTIKE